MLDTVLVDYKPNTWTNVNYNNRRYALVPIGPYDSEYKEVTALFFPYTIKRAERVQHPYALGYFSLRKKQLLSRGQRIYEDRHYHPISFANKTVALEHNLDVRKYTVGSGQQNTKLYKDIHDLLVQYDTFIVCNVLINESSLNKPVLEPLYESEYMPEYVVKLI